MCQGEHPENKESVIIDHLLQNKTKPKKPNKFGRNGLYGLVQDLWQDQGQDPILQDSIQLLKWW